MIHRHNDVVFNRHLPSSRMAPSGLWGGGGGGGGGGATGLSTDIACSLNCAKHSHFIDVSTLLSMGVRHVIGQL